MPAKLSGRIRYEKRLYAMKNPKRLLLEELACEAEVLENDVEIAETLIKKFHPCYGKICVTTCSDKKSSCLAWEYFHSPSALQGDDEK